MLNTLRCAVRFFAILFVCIGKATRVHWCLSITTIVIVSLPSDSIYPLYISVIHQLTTTEYYDAYLTSLNEAGEQFVEALCNGIARSIRARQNTAGMITPAPPTPAPSTPRINLGNVGRRVAAMNARLRESMEVPSILSNQSSGSRVSESSMNEFGMMRMLPSACDSSNPSSSLAGAASDMDVSEMTAMPSDTHHSPSPSSVLACASVGQSALAQALGDDYESTVADSFMTESTWSLE